jgi:dethiobiotin synthetase
VILFVGGIDTGIGKTVATGLLARWYGDRLGLPVVTQKLVQTGCVGFPEDIRVHRRLMGTDLLDEDRAGLTCPYVFRFPGSPQLAAALEGGAIETGRLAQAAAELERRRGVVLVEGVGGLCVPLTPEATVLDFVAGQGWPVILVTSSRLGSINHTLLSLEALKSRGVRLAAVLYNLHGAARPEIVEDSRRVIREAVDRMGFSARVSDLPPAGAAGIPRPDFDGLLLPMPGGGR